MFSAFVSAFGCARKSESRPSVDFYLDTLPNSIHALYDTGSEVSLLRSDIFRKIAVHKRPRRLNMDHIQVFGANGSQLNVKGCYSLPIQILGKWVNHTFFVVDDLSYEALLGIDFANAHSLSYDAWSHKVYFPDYNPSSKIPKAMLSKDSYLPSNSATVHSVLLKDEKNEPLCRQTCIISLDVPADPSIAQDNLLVSTDSSGSAFIELFNTALSPLKLPKHLTVGRVECLPPDEPIVELASLGRSVMNISKSSHQSTFLPNVSLVNPKPPKETTAPPSTIKYLLDKLKVEHLPPQEREEYRHLVCKNHDIFATSEMDISRCTIGKHSIPLSDPRPVYSPQFPIPFAHRSFLEERVTEWLEAGVVRPCHSPYNSAIFCVRKKLHDGTIGWRPVLDYRKLNKQSLQDNYRLPLITECLNALSGCQLFSTLDIKHGFHQILLEEKDQLLTAFTIPSMGQFCWQTTPFGLRNIPLTFQRVMDMMLKNLIPSICLAYLDDVVIKSVTNHEEMRNNLQTVFNRVRESGFKLNLEKCSFGTKKVTYLGYEVTPEGYRPAIPKTTAISNAPPPESVKGIRQFIGLCGFFRNSIHNFAKFAAPLTRCTRADSGYHGGQLPPEAIQSYEKLKKALVSRPLLAFPQPNRPFELYVDASELGWGATLVQRDNKGLPHPISYASRQVKPHEMSYTSYLMEMAAANWGIDYFDVYLRGNHFTLFTDNKPLTTLTTRQTKSLHDIQIQMMKYSFDTKYFAGHLNPADWLSRNVHMIETNTQITTQTFFPNFEALELQQRTDPFTSSMKNYLNHGELPIYDSTLSSLVKRYAPNCFLKDDLVCIKFQREGQLAETVPICPAELQSQMLSEAHCSATGGHAKNFKTYSRILQLTWWPGLFADVERFINECNKCQETAAAPRFPNAPLKPLECPKTPLDTVHIDLMGPYPSSYGHKYLVIISDAFTKFAEFTTIDTKTPENTAKAFFETWVARYGVPAVLISDRGTEWRASLFRELGKLLRIDHRMTSPYYPQSNAKSEVINKTVISYIKATIERLQDWPDLIPSLQLSYNTGVSKATQFSPFQLMFGLRPKTPFTDPNLIDKKFYGEQYPQMVMQRLQHSRDIALKNRLNYVDTYKKYYDSRIKEQSFHLNQTVYIWKPNLKPGQANKFKNGWTGPCIIKKFTSDKSALVYDVVTKKTHHANFSLLKPCNAKMPPQDIPEQNSALPTKEQRSKVNERARSQEDAVRPKPDIYFERWDEDIVAERRDSQPVPAPIPIKEETTEDPPTVETEPLDTTQQTVEENLPEESSVTDEESEIHREMFGHLPAPKTQQKGNVKPTVKSKLKGLLSPPTYEDLGAHFASLSGPLSRSTTRKFDVAIDKSILNIPPTPLERKQRSDRGKARRDQPP